MAEFPDANSGGLDPNGAGPCGIAKPAIPMWRRVRAWTIIGLAYVFILGMAASAISMLWRVLRPGLAWDDRLEHLLWSGALLLPLIFVARYFVRVRLKTGRWGGTKEQRRQDREMRQAQCAARGSTNGYRAKQQPWTKLLRAWASCTAMDKTRSTAERAAAWAVLAGYVAVMLALTALGVICIGAGLPDGKSSATPMMIGFGLLILVIPAIAVRNLVRGIRAGTLGTTRAEFEQMRGQQAAWRVRESQKPTRAKLTSAAVALAIYGWYWMRVTVHHARHPHETWITPVSMTPFVIYSIYIQFRRPKNAAGGADEAAGATEE